MLILCVVAIIASISFLIFNDRSFYSMQKLIPFNITSDSRVDKINTLASIIGVTALFLILYLTRPNKLYGIRIFLIKNINPYIALPLFVIILISIFSFGNINNSNFWLDESGQIWISLGLNHFSPPFSEPGGFKDVFVNNIKYNMDPGGFTYLLYFWLKFGESPALVFNPITYPIYYDCKFLPDKFKKDFTDRLATFPEKLRNAGAGETFIDYINDKFIPISNHLHSGEFNQIAMNEFVTITEKLDEIRKEKFNTVFTNFNNVSALLKN
jgi:hypothetical protein